MEYQVYKLINNGKVPVNKVLLSFNKTQLYGFFFAQSYAMDIENGYYEYAIPGSKELAKRVRIFESDEENPLDNTDYSEYRLSKNNKYKVAIDLREAYLRDKEELREFITGAITYATRVGIPLKGFVFENITTKKIVTVKVDGNVYDPSF